ncbi:MAG TPA: DNA-processing protein DprA [Candidatus Acidoferrum sp.]|nr:DNA-processing protein DprA [Candidatus Acidoferrum sp.]
MADIHALWLAAALPPDAPCVFRLLDCFGSPREIYEAGRESLSATGLLTGAELRALCDKSMAGAKYIEENCRKYCVEVTHPWQEDYPPLLSHIAQPPVTLYYKGDLAALTKPLTLAVVGTRGCTPYGEGCAYDFAKALAGCGITIVSGLAEGIDAAAHRGAIEGGGRTAAVMATGHDRVYPFSNSGLYEEILKTGGAILSEYYPECRVEKNSFVIRNRIVSGLSYGTLIAEAGERSGALATARHTLDQDRDLFALPGPVTSPSSKGTNGLIKSLSARAVTEPADILAEYIALYPEKLYLPARPAADSSAALSRDEERLSALLVSGGGMSPRLLLRLSGMEEHRLSETLTQLIHKGMIKKLPDGRFDRTERK